MEVSGHITQGRMMTAYVTFNTSPALLKKAASPSDVYANYDWDDNIIFMPTLIIYFAKDANNLIQELGITTEGFAHTRSKVGVESHLMSFKNIDGMFVQCATGEEGSIEIDIQDYQVVYDKDEAKLTEEERKTYDVFKTSFREFRDHENKECYFLKHLKMAIENKTFGPSFNDFVEHCSHKDSAKNVTIITARGQSPRTIHNGMKHLKKMGLIKHVPPFENVYPVSFKGNALPAKYQASASSPQGAKLAVLIDILDHLNLNCSGATFGFSDDDKKTFDFTENFIAEEIKKGRWSNVQINLYFTGTRAKERKVMLNPEFDPQVA